LAYVPWVILKEKQHYAITYISVVWFLNELTIKGPLFFKIYIYIVNITFYCSMGTTNYALLAFVVMLQVNFWLVRNAKIMKRSENEADDYFATLFSLFLVVSGCSS
jgi:hypothetical protein